MKYYRPVMSGSRDPRSIAYFFSSRKGDSYPWPEGSWVPSKEMMYMAFQDAPMFNENVKKELPKLTVVIRPKVEELPDVIGQFSSNTAGSPPMIRKAVKELIEEKFPGTCEFIQASKIWDDVFKRDIDARDYYFTNVIKYLDGWDHELSDIRVITRKDGSKFHTLQDMGVVNHPAAKGAHLWRDRFTKDVVCSGEFKTCMEDLGVSNVHYYELKSNK